MSRILVISSQRRDYQKIRSLLGQSPTQDFELEWCESARHNIFKASQFKAVLICVADADQAAEEQLQTILEQRPSGPLIALIPHANSTLDNRLMAFGIDDCLPLDDLPLNNLGQDFLLRCIQHAINRKQTNTKISYMATHDQLTGLANRFLLYEHIEHSISRARRHGNHFALLFLDLDKFKLINDSLGHDVGDLLLRQVSDRLSASVRAADVLARFSGDEFIILLDDVKSHQNIANAARNLQTALESPFRVHGHELFVTTSIGVASFPENGIEVDGLLKSADSALNQAKELGRNQFHFCSNELNNRVMQKLALEKNLRRALINQEFEIYFQPQIAPRTGEIAGAEALLRWNHPRLGIVSPVQFIPLLDELGLLVGVEEWVIREVCMVASEIVKLTGPVRFSVNISGSHFKRGNLKESIYLALQSSMLDAKHLEIELTEDVMIEHVERNNHILNDIAEIGVSIALDDFGKGYSSLSYLRNFPADVLKIDKAFIDQLGHAEKDTAIVEAMIDLSHKLGIKVVAEGVEIGQQMQFLRDKGCDYIQGYYYAKPMPLKEFRHFVARSLARNRSQTKNSKRVSARI